MDDIHQLEGQLIELRRSCAVSGEILAILHDRPGTTAYRAIMERVRGELGAARAILGRIEDPGWVLCIQSTDEEEWVVPAADLPAPWRDAMAGGKARIDAGTLFVPLRDRGAAAGILIFEPGPHPLTEADLRFADSLQAGLASAVGNRVSRQKHEYLKIKAIEDAYRFTEAKLRAIFDESQDMIVTTDGEGHVLDMNRAGLRLLGLDTADQVLGLPEESFWVNPGDHVSFLKTITTQGWVKDFEVILRCHDGKSIFGLESASLIRGPDGGIVEVHAMVKDISQRIRDEQAMWKMNVELADANQKLKASQMMILQQEKLASIGQLAAGIAHEINNPLGFLKSNHGAIKRHVAALKAFTEALEAGAAELVGREKAKHDIPYVLADFDAIMSESDDGFRRIADIVQNLRNFSRIDAAEKFALSDINKGIENTLAVARNEVKYVAEVRTTFAPLPLVECIGGEINQVFLNLVVNAAQAIKSQGRSELGVIEVVTTALEDRIAVEIRDDGPGIREGLELRIFDPFFTTKPVGQGTGLGLSISFDIIVQKHGGRLTVGKSLLGGACFRIELPVQHVAAAAPVPPAAQPPA